jgi:hypothetical protein
MWSYLKAAFLASPHIPGLGKVPVNLVALLGFCPLAFLDPAFPALLLLGLGLEVAYLFGLATRPRFRKYVDAQKAKAARESLTAQAPGDTVQRILGELPAASVKRFEALRKNCQDLQQIAAQLRDPERADVGASLEDLQLAGLDRLLWIYLRLLFTRHMLDRAFQSSGEDQIAHEIRGLEEQLRALGNDPKKQKLRKTLEDNLETCRQRVATYEAAREKGELVRLELDRLENKIRGLNEMAVSRHEPNFIAGQVDQVAASMVQTERTMQELQFATGLSGADEQVPQLLRREAVAAGR